MIETSEEQRPFAPAARGSREPVGRLAYSLRRARHFGTGWAFASVAASMLASGVLWESAGTIVAAGWYLLAMPVPLLALAAIRHSELTTRRLLEEALAVGGDRTASGTDADLIDEARSRLGALRHEQHGRRRAESTLDALPEAVIRLDAAGTVEFVNAAARALLDPPAGDCHGRPLRDALLLDAPDLADVAGQLLNRARHDGRAHRVDAVMTLRHRERAVFDLECTLTPLADLPGAQRGYALVLRRAAGPLASQTPAAVASPIPAQAKAIEDRWELALRPAVPTNPNGPSDAYCEAVVVDRAAVAPFADDCAAAGARRAIDGWAVAATLGALASGRAPGLAGVLAVRLSAESLADESTLERCIAEVRAAGPVRERLCFEFEESALRHHPEHAGYFVAAVKALGCKVAIAEFGLGNGACRLLKQLPVDYLKINGMLVRNLTQSSIDYEVVRGVSRVAQALRIETIATGVADSATHEALRSLGINFAQGRAVSPAEPATTVRRPAREAGA